MISMGSMSWASVLILPFYLLALGFLIAGVFNIIDAVLNKNAVSRKRALLFMASFLVMVVVVTNLIHFLQNILNKIY